MRCPTELADARRGGTEADRYLVPSAQTVAAVRAAMRELLAPDARRDAGLPDLTAAGLEIVAVAGAADLVVVRERSDVRRGSGAYLVRLGSRSDLVVQTPHTFFDQGTLELGCALFDLAAARALFVDTAHRYRAAAADESGRFPADVAHAADSVFQAATLGALDAGSAQRFVQLHGFADREEGAAAVVSRGVAVRDNEELRKVATALAALLGAPVHRFPDDTSALGATTNVQGDAVRRAGASFLHVELSATTRERLGNDEALRRALMQSLMSALTSG